MNGKFRNGKCVDCQYCTRTIGMGKSGKGVLFCENPQTKESTRDSNPIGFLDERAECCKYFTTLSVAPCL